MDAFDCPISIYLVITYSVNTMFPSIPAFGTAEDAKAVFGGCLIDQILVNTNSIAKLQIGN
jgi:hypothetical protein